MPHSRSSAALATLVVLVLVSFSAAIAAPISYTYEAVITQATGMAGLSVGEEIYGSLAYDPDTALGCGSGCYGSTDWTFSAAVGSFSQAESFRWQLIDGSPGADEQRLEGAGPAQFGLLFGDNSGTALPGVTLADLNVYLEAWNSVEVRYHELAADGALLRGWTGALTYIGVPVSVPAPASLALLSGGIALLGGVRRRLRA